MNLVRLSHILTSTVLVSAAPSFADSWTVTQNMTASTSVTLSQSGGSGSTQAINAVNLGSNSTVHGNQSVNVGSNPISLTQTGSSNTQAANFIAAGTIVSATSQSVTAGNATLVGGGSNNKQALNMAFATNTGGLTQSVNLSGAATFSLPVGSSNNVQAGNYLDTDNITGNVSQTFNSTNKTVGTIFNDAGTNNLQAANALIRKNGGSFTAGATVTQTFNSSSVTIKNNTKASTKGAVANYFALK